jgi:hypothetical protein
MASPPSGEGMLVGIESGMLADGSVNGSRTHDRTLPDQAPPNLGRCLLGHCFLFQFHEEQNEDRPYPNGYRKLNQLCVSQCTSSWNRKRKPQHSQSREYPEGQFGFGVHRGFASLILRRASSSQNQESATTPVARITNGRHRRTVYQYDAAPSRQ